MTRRARHLPLAEALAEYVFDGASVALEGFTHLIPFAAGHELIRQRRRNLHLIRMTPDLIYDQMIGMGCASRLTFSWGGNPGVGSLHRLRDAIEHGWPQPLAIDEHSHAGMAAAYTAGAARLPFGVLRGYVGTDLAHVNPNVRSVTCPYTGEELATVPAIRPDVTILHAQRADRRGNVAIEGIVGAQREIALAADCLIVTVEAVVEELPPAMNGLVLPHWVVTAVSHVPGGAYPSYAQGCYMRDNAFYTAWDAIARDRGRFIGWMEQHVIGTHDHAAFLASLKQAAA
jgi:glutaconate CoA-transferase subunit A